MNKDSLDHQMRNIQRRLLELELEQAKHDLVIKSLLKIIDEL